MRKLRLAAFAALGILSAAPAAAASFADSLTGGSLNPALSMTISDPSYTYATTGTGLTLSHAAGAGNGYEAALSTLSFSGAFSLSVDAAGLTSGLDSAAEAGLAISSSGGGSADIFAFNNNPGYANNSLGVSLNSTPIAGGKERLSINGNTGGASYTFSLFLLQEYGGLSANSVTFSNLALSADTITGAAPVPEPGEWAMMAGGLAVVGAAARRRKTRSTGAAL